MCRDRDMPLRWINYEPLFTCSLLSPVRRAWDIERSRELVRELQGVIARHECVCVCSICWPAKIRVSATDDNSPLCVTTSAKTVVTPDQLAEREISFSISIEEKIYDVTPTNTRAYNPVAHHPLLRRRPPPLIAAPKKKKKPINNSTANRREGEPRSRACVCVLKCRQIKPSSNVDSEVAPEPGVPAAATRREAFGGPFLQLRRKIPPKIEVFAKNVWETVTACVVSTPCKWFWYFFADFVLHSAVICRWPALFLDCNLSRRGVVVVVVVKRGGHLKEDAICRLVKGW